VADLYSRLGFAGPERGEDGTLWSWDLASGVPHVPDWFKTVDLTGSVH
jgi:hypothetical protein